MRLIRERHEDPKGAALRRCLVMIKRIYDLTGDPEVKDVIDEATAALGHLPRPANSEKPQLSLPASQ
jgi:hypothetical protein